MRHTMAEQNTKIIVKPLQQTSIFPELLDGFAHSQKITKKWVKQNDKGLDREVIRMLYEYAELRGSHKKNYLLVTCRREMDLWKV